MVMKPVSFELRTYQIGFGDCFLLSVVYDGGQRRHALIDFGTTQNTKLWSRRDLTEIAADIDRVTGGTPGKRGKLNMVVATHRHKDHISGFAGDSGEVIAELKPDLVVQPWTEDPDVATAATSPDSAPDGNHSLVRALGSMQAFAANVQEQWMDLLGLHREMKKKVEDLSVDYLSKKIEEVLRSPKKRLGREMQLGLSESNLKELMAVGLTNVSNRAAVESLLEMGAAGGRKPKYAHFGNKVDVRGVLPGVKVHVLGPPTVDQSPKVRSQRSTDPDEYWHMRENFWLAHERSHSLAERGDLFPGADHARGVPLAARWAVPKAQQARSSQLLSIVRALDSALNNTSLILLFEIGDKKLLFPGDAQIENWQYVLDKAHKDTAEGRRLARLLCGVDVYKVGHHGSLNATPKTLWGMFDKRSSDAAEPSRMHSVVSTRNSVHGSTWRNTEVPRRTLVDALASETNFHTTLDLRKKADYVNVLEMPV